MLVQRKHTHIALSYILSCDIAIELTHQKLGRFVIYNITQVLFLPFNLSILLSCCWEFTAGHIWLCIDPRFIILHSTCKEVLLLLWH